VAEFNLVIEGKGLEPVLEKLARADEVRVLGPHMSRHFLGGGVDGTRIVLRVDADSVAAAQELVRGFLPTDGDFSVGPC
jgi:hypothetical protein